MTEKHDKPLYIRLKAEDLERLDALAENISVATRTAIAREALLIGLAAIEKDPSVLLGASLPKRGGARKGAGRKARPKRK